METNNYGRSSEVGVVKGKVVTRSGNPAAGVNVSGKLSGFMGGFTQAITDREGRFVLTYPGVGSLEYVSVSCGDKEFNVRSGSELLLYKG
ncbi:MAG: hypothetical protein Q7R48_03805 [bacterium]|nr:hypothetical protein [bacterium]